MPGILNLGGLTSRYGSPCSGLSRKRSPPSSPTTPPLPYFRGPSGNLADASAGSSAATAPDKESDISFPDPNAPPRRRPSPRTDAAETELRRWIVQSGRRAGDRLPPDVELADTLNVARSTVISALDRLVADGTATRRQGSGTFVNAPAVPGHRERFEVLMAQTELARAAGVEIDTDLLESSPEAADHATAQALAVEPGTSVLRITRVVSRDGRPCAVLENRLSPVHPMPPAEELVPLVAAHGSLLATMLALGEPVCSGYARIDPVVVTPDGREGRLLSLDEPAPALRITETQYCTRGGPLTHNVDLVMPWAWPVSLQRTLSASRAAPPTALPPRGRGREDLN